MPEWSCWGAVSQDTPTPSRVKWDSSALANTGTPSHRMSASSSRRRTWRTDCGNTLKPVASANDSIMSDL